MREMTSQYLPHLLGVHPTQQGDAQSNLGLLVQRRDTPAPVGFVFMWIAFVHLLGWDLFKTDVACTG